MFRAFPTLIRETSSTTRTYCGHTSVSNRRRIIFFCTDGVRFREKRLHINVYWNLMLCYLRLAAKWSSCNGSHLNVEDNECRDVDLPSTRHSLLRYPTNLFLFLHPHFSYQLLRPLWVFRLLQVLLVLLFHRLSEQKWNRVLKFDMNTLQRHGAP